MRIAGQNGHSYAQPDIARQHDGVPPFDASNSAPAWRYCGGRCRRDAATRNAFLPLGIFHTWMNTLGAVQRIAIGVVDLTAGCREF